MKNVKRILTAALAVSLVCILMLTGCSIPRIEYNSIPETAATYGDGKTISSGEYLAYLYLEFENMYYNQGLYYSEMYGEDPWEQTFPYGDTDEKLVLSDYIIRSTQDNIKRQIVLDQMMKEYGINWIEEDLKNVQKNLDQMQADLYLPLGFSNDSYATVMKALNLNERSLFYGLYGKDGQKAVKEEDLKKYFADNYVSYKMLSIALTDKDGKELKSDSEVYKKLMALMDGYMETYKKEGFDAAYKQFQADQTKISDIKKGTTTTTTTTTTAPTTTTTTTAHSEDDGHDHDHEEEEDKDPNRIDADSSNMDEALKDAIFGKKDKDGKVEQEGVKVGECKMVNYKASGSTATVALIERLDINVDRNGKKDGLYEDSIESIIYELKYEEFNKEVKANLEKLTIDFNSKVVDSDKTDPKLFVDIINNL